MRTIDADALRDNLQAIAHDDWNQGVTTSWADAYREFADMVEEMPTIEPKKGEWIIQDNPETGWYRVVCSECGEDVTSNIPMIGFFPHCKPLWDYCPECGSDMRGET